MKTKIFSATLLLLISICLFAFRIADDPFEAILKKLASYNQENPQEKVHLHLDKPYYAIGDDIWFKAYVTDSRTDQPSLISSALYVELIGVDDSVKKQIKLPLNVGLAWGDFKLPDTLSEGNYRIRAYTQWMRNAGPDYFFDKTIKIGNAWANKVFTATTSSYTTKGNEQLVNSVIRFTDKQGNPYVNRPVSYEVKLKDKIAERGKGLTNSAGEITVSYSSKQAETQNQGDIKATITLENKQVIVKRIPVKTTSDNIAVQLFPEGGNLVEDLPSKVAVKAVNTSGLGEDFSGEVIDNDQIKVSDFNTSHFGMSTFMLNPQQGKTYTVKLKFKNGKEQTIAVPKALPAGYILSMYNADSTKLSGKILISSSLLRTGELKLVLQHNNQVLSVIKASSEKQVIAFSIAKSTLPAGIINLTLLTPDNVPAAERMLFIRNPAEQLNIGLANLKTSYAPREHVNLDFSAKDGNTPAEGSFSVAVTNSSVINPDLENESNIFTSLLLKSDLKGYIEKPNYYFLNTDKKTNEELDNLMLTQGWSRLVWKDITGNIAAAPVFPAEHTLHISGLVTTPGGKPIPKGKVSLFSTSGGLFLIDTLTDDKGRFNFDRLTFGDSTKFVVQARNAKDKKYVEIKLDIIPGQVVTKNQNTGDIEVNVNEVIQGYLKQSENYFNDLTKRGLLQRSFLLDQVNIVQKKTVTNYSSNLNGGGNADAVIKSSDLGNYPTLSQALQGKVAGMVIQNGKPYLLRNSGKEMQLIIDGVYVEADFLDNINPNDVATIEILKTVANTAIYGIRGGGGIMVITTKRGGDATYATYAPGIMTYSPKGYYAVRQFYSPQYTPGSTIAGEDRRSTVYWNPLLNTDNNGNAKFNFYNTDETGTYRVVIEGINDKGQLARGVYTYEVK